MSVHIFGIRHHGAGSARSLCRALSELQPDALLIEGPPDADPIIPMIAASEMQPPVALLVYAIDRPGQAAWYPFALYSPEWQALHYAQAHGVPCAFMDLPQTHSLALEREALTAAVAMARGGDPSPRESPDPATPAPEEALQPDWSDGDPFQDLARLAGYTDGERWWELMVEERRDTQGLFEAILEIMAEVRTGTEEPLRTPARPQEALREAWMRETIRAAERRHARIAVVCGAWHAPALVDREQPEQDKALLRNLPAIETAATWAPWTYSRLARSSGYGAGITSPGWYHHLWETPPDQVTSCWLARVAALLRAEDLMASTAQVIDAVRLAVALAALRGRPAPGLDELTEATLAVLCRGDATPLTLIHDRLIVGDRMGSVPTDAPAVPLQRDLEAQQKQLRLKPSVEERVLDLDLRQPTDLARSRLFHRLRLLQIPWAAPAPAQVRATGTFHEFWTLQWQPEAAVALLEAAVWGNTVAEASEASVRATAKTTALPDLTRLLEHVLLADLPAAAGHLMGQVEQVAALTSDIGLLMDALPALAAVRRYGSVRQTEGATVAHILDGLVARICIGIGPACASLDDEAAAQVADRMGAVDNALAILQQEEYRRPWQHALRQLANRTTLHGLLAGRAVRFLHVGEVLPPAEVVRLMGLALSPASPPSHAAAWLEGFLRGSGHLLLHDDDLWQLLDRWLARLSAPDFDHLLPLLRRTLATMAPPERRRLGERARLGQRSPVAETPELDEERAARVLPILQRLLGMES